MLSGRQCELVILKVNQETDIPFLKESTEAKVIEKILGIVNPNLEDSMRSLCPAPYIDCLKIALKEGIPADEKRRLISDIMYETLSKPLAATMAGMIDISLVPEAMEERILDVVCKKIVDEFIEWTVGEIDERMNTRLEQSREVSLPEAKEEQEEGEVIEDAEE